MRRHLLGIALGALVASCPHPPGITVHTAHRSALDRVKADLVARYGAAVRARVERGARQVLSYWRPSDGPPEALARFFREQFVASPAELDRSFRRFEEIVEQIEGHFVELGRTLRYHSEVDSGPMLPVDKLFAAIDPGAHVVEDLYRSKVAFAALANFPLTTLAERLREGPRWTRRQWAEARLTGRIARRIPGEVQQKIAEATARADLYIATYNLFMHHLVDERGTRLFPKGLRLITHWNLRDELKAAYAEKGGLAKQRAIAKVMERIVTQTIPAVVIDNPTVDWNPFTNEVRPAPPETVEKPHRPRAGPVHPAREPDTRYAHLLECFHAARAADPYSPLAPTHIARRFEIDREIPEARFRAILEEILASPLLPRLARIIQRRLGRPLEPFDIWYDGFRPRGKFQEAELDAITRKRYPTAAAFQADIPAILEKLGFTPERARYLADRIVVDPSRGAGHALGAMRRQDKARLRTRVEPGGMNYKGFNIAVHELGHNVEQVFSLFDVDHTLLQGVPNTAFTEALAFVFQARDLEILGLSRPDPAAERLKAMNELWMTYEIGGVGLVDMEVWHWMYRNPDATAAQLREAVLAIARQVWNRYFAPVLGARDVTLLAIYSHMISNLLYLPDYSLGHIIAFQIEQHVKKAGPLGPEFERMARYGMVTPDLWMQHATGRPISPSVLLDAAREAIEAEEKR